MGTLRAYWLKANKEERKRYAQSFGSSVENTTNRYTCKNPLRRQMPSLNRLRLMMLESGGDVTAEGLAFDFVIEPLAALARKEKAPMKGL